MSRNRGVMCRLDRSNRRFPRFHAVEEVALMARWDSYSLTFGILPAMGQGRPSGIRRIKSAPVHPDPAVGPDPFCPHHDFRIAACDCHPDVHGIMSDFLAIAAFDHVFRRGVPYRIRGRKLPMAFNFRRAGASNPNPNVRCRRDGQSSPSTGRRQCCNSSANSDKRVPQYTAPSSMARSTGRNPVPAAAQ